MSKDNLLTYGGSNPLATGDDANTASAYVKRDSSGNINCQKANVVGHANSGADFESIATVTSNYSVGSNDYAILADATSAAFAITLPTVSGNSGRVLKIKKIDSAAHNVTIQTPDSTTIDGASTKVISTQYAVVTLQNNGLEWYILGN